MERPMQTRSFWLEANMFRCDEQSRPFNVSPLPAPQKQHTLRMNTCHVRNKSGGAFVYVQRVAAVSGGGGGGAAAGVALAPTRIYRWVFHRLVVLQTSAAAAWYTCRQAMQIGSAFPWQVSRMGGGEADSHRETTQYGTLPGPMFKSRFLRFEHNSNTKMTTCVRKARLSRRSF